MSISRFKNALTVTLSRNRMTHGVLFHAKKSLGKLPRPDYSFPQKISLEISSLCNLACVHCPPHSREYKAYHRKYGHMDMDLFHRVMDEIDQYGPRHISLHKDGEPLLHPEMPEILDRVKRDRNHTVYLTTNGHKLDSAMGQRLLKSRIDYINFSIGAASQEFYAKVRGKGFHTVLSNIEAFLGLIPESGWQPHVQVQILNLPEFPEMKNEIRQFKSFWKKFDVDINVWEKLSWGVLDTPEIRIKRYPCYSLWDSLFVNSDGKVSACCMDWRQELIPGDATTQSLAQIWAADPLKNLRAIHLQHEEDTIPMCRNCNYWSWLPRTEFPEP